MARMTEREIKFYEAHGFKRWTKGSMDRLYINVQKLGAEISYYKTGNVSNAKWLGEQVSNADGRRLLATKVWVDVKTGELQVRTNFSADYDIQEVEEVARELVDGIKAELANTDDEPDKDDESEEGADAAREAIRTRMREYAARQLDAARAHYAGKLTPEQLEANEREYERVVQKLLDVIAAKDGAWVLAHAESPAESIVAEVSK